MITTTDTLPRGDAYVRLEAIRAAHPEMVYAASEEERNALADAFGLWFLVPHWSAVEVEVADGAIRNAWITESSRPFEVSAEFLSVVRDGALESWARAANAFVGTQRANDWGSTNAPILP